MLSQVGSSLGDLSSNNERATFYMAPTTPLASSKWLAAVNTYWHQRVLMLCCISTLVKQIMFCIQWCERRHFDAMLTLSISFGHPDHLPHTYAHAQHEIYDTDLRCQCDVFAAGQLGNIYNHSCVQVSYRAALFAQLRFGSQNRVVLPLLHRERC